MQFFTLVCLTWAALVTGFLLGCWWENRLKGSPSIPQAETRESLGHQAVQPTLAMDDQWKNFWAYDGKKPEQPNEEDET